MKQEKRKREETGEREKQMNIVATEMITLGDISWDMILGGFALFLFGIKFMGDGLKNVAGHKLREYIDKYTSNPLMAVLVGDCRHHCRSVFFGGDSDYHRFGPRRFNETRTGGRSRRGCQHWNNDDRVSDRFKSGTVCHVLCIHWGHDHLVWKEKENSYIGDIILGFGLMFYGLKIMGDSLKMLKDLPAFIEFAKVWSEKPVLGY